MRPEVFLQRLWESLPRHSGGGRQLFRLSLTFPKWSPDETRHKCAVRFADELGRMPHEGLWLVLDVSRSGRPHFYGVALSSRDMIWIMATWLSLSGADEAATKVRRITGQGGTWDDSNTKLRLNLSRVVGYALKQLPSDAETGPFGRVVSSGVLEEVWRPASVPERSAVCIYCGGPVVDRRSHARYCRDSCRTLAYRARGRVDKAFSLDFPPGDELDTSGDVASPVPLYPRVRKWAEAVGDDLRARFDERAAILEFDGGLPRWEAEHEALMAMTVPCPSTSTEKGQQR